MAIFAMLSAARWAQFAKPLLAASAPLIASRVSILGRDERLTRHQSGDDPIVRLLARLPDQPVHAIRLSVPT